MSKFFKLSLFLVLGLFLFGETYAAQFCYNQDLHKSERVRYTEEAIDNLLEEYPELDFGDLEYNIVHDNSLSDRLVLGETRVEIQKKQEKRFWSDGREEILREWEEVRVPSVTFDGSRDVYVSSLPYTWVHEHAHVFYYRYMTAEQRDEWTELSQGSGTSVTEYGKQDPQEDFAEWFTFYYYPHIFVGRYCMLDTDTLSSHSKNKFFERMRGMSPDRLNWLTRPQEFLSHLKKGGQIGVTENEQIARDEYRVQNGIFFASAPKEVEEKEPVKVRTRSYPSFLTQAKTQSTKEDIPRQKPKINPNTRSEINTQVTSGIEVSATKDPSFQNYLNMIKKRRK